MSEQQSRRWAFLLSALVITVGAIAYPVEHSAAPDAIRPAKPLVTEAVKLPSTKAADPDWIAMDSDPFATRTWETAEVLTNADAPPPASASLDVAPVVIAAPPLPFKFVGKMVDDGKTIVYLNLNEQLVVAREGEEIEGGYKVRSIGPPTFTFDAFGNLIRTTDPKGNIIRVTYDDWGRRTKLEDPDLGVITYDVNPLGQVWRQISPYQRRKGFSTITQFDVLGRMTNQTSQDMTASWTYDLLPGQLDCAAYKSCGQLVSSKTLAGGTAVDYRQEQTYDVLGRPDEVSTFLDAKYTTKIGYDTWGRVVRETHQRGTSAAKIFDHRYNAYGELARIERAGVPLWTLTAQDASRRQKGLVLGNGLVTTKDFNAMTGRLFISRVATPSGTQTLRETNTYDLLGNVDQRTQEWGLTHSFTETFKYDGMNRLWTAQIAGYPEQVFGYDDIGNLTSKTGVGTGVYAYPGSGLNSYTALGASNQRPHAVYNIPGVGVGPFVYDDNGNMTSGAGRTAEWNSFDMPTKIAKGGEWSEFYYGPDRQRVKQVRSDGTTIWHAGRMEVARMLNDQIKVKTYLPGGVGVEVDTTTETKIYYTHTDRLGSVIALTDETGVLSEKSAYDSWGKRRDYATPLTHDSDFDTTVDNKGFTGHEMLDRIDLVHMNGRVYDPLVARFLSADPIIQDPLHSQSYNRYSYVWNNPTNLTDPTGFVGEGNSSAFAGPDGSCDARCQQLQKEADKRAENCTGNCSYSGPGRTEQQKTNSADRSGIPKHIDLKVAWSTSARSGNPVGQGHMRINPNWLAERERYYGSSDEIMGQWFSFSLLEKFGSSMGASDRQIFWIGMAGMLGSPKDILKNGVRKAVEKSATSRRVSLRKGTLDKIKTSQPKNASGEMLDPHTGELLKPGEIDIGHTPGNEWRKRKADHETAGRTRKEVIEAENDPSLYHLEDRAGNRSHKYEID